MLVMPMQYIAMEDYGAQLQYNFVSEVYNTHKLYFAKSGGLSSSLIVTLPNGGVAR